MPENKKYVTLDQLQRFYKRITHNDEGSLDPAVQTFDGEKYYGQFNLNFPQDGVYYYDNIGELIVYIPYECEQEYGPFIPPHDTYFIINQVSTEIDTQITVSYVDELGNISFITQSGPLTINNRKYYIQGNFVEQEVGLPGDELPPTTVQNLQIYFINTNSWEYIEEYEDRLHAQLELYVVPVPTFNLVPVDVASNSGGTDFWFQLYNSKANDWDMNLANYAYDIGFQILQYYLNKYGRPTVLELHVLDPYDMQDTFHTQLFYNYNSDIYEDNISTFPLIKVTPFEIMTYVNIAVQPANPPMSSTINLPFVYHNQGTYFGTLFCLDHGARLVALRQPYTIYNEKENQTVIFNADDVTIQMVQGSEGEGTDTNSGYAIHYQLCPEPEGIIANFPPASWPTYKTLEGDWDFRNELFDTYYSVIGVGGACVLNDSNQIINMWGDITFYVHDDPKF